MSYGTDRAVVTVTISNGTSLSNEVNVNNRRIVGVVMPATWTAAGVGLEALISETSTLPKTQVFKPVVDTGGTEFTITTGGDRYIALPDTQPLIALGRVKVRSGSSGAPVNQGGDRVIGLVLVNL